MWTFCVFQYIPKTNNRIYQVIQIFLILVPSSFSININEGFFNNRLVSLLELFNNEGNKGKNFFKNFCIFLEKVVFWKRFWLVSYFLKIASIVILYTVYITQRTIPGILLSSSSAPATNLQNASVDFDKTFPNYKNLLWNLLKSNLTSIGI